MGEINGRAMSDAAAAMFLADLMEYPPDSIIVALKKCRLELNRFPNIADVVSRIQHADGRPGAELAWAMCPKTDGSAAFLNEEIMSGWDAANEILRFSGDAVAARMAFKETYEKAVKENRDNNISPKWWLSRAHGPNAEIENQNAMRSAVERKLISPHTAVLLLPTFVPQESQMKQISNSNDIKKIISTTMKKME